MVKSESEQLELRRLKLAKRQRDYAHQKIRSILSYIKEKRHPHKEKNWKFPTIAERIEQELNAILYTWSEMAEAERKKIELEKVKQRKLY